MGMVMEIQRIDDDLIESLIADPDEAAWRIMGLDQRKKPGFFQRLFGKKEKKPRREWKAPPEEEIVYLDKAWHGIHYLLTGKGDEGNPERSFLMYGRLTVLTDVLDFPIIFHKANEVKTFVNSIAKEPIEAILGRYDERKMRREDIYLFEDPESLDEELKDYILSHTKNLIEFLKITSEKKQGIAISIG